MAAGAAVLSDWYLNKAIRAVYRHPITYIALAVYGGLFLVFSLTGSSEIAIIKAMAISICLFIASVTDIRSREIPNKLLLVFLVLGILLVAPSFNSLLYLDALGGALIAGGLLYTASVFTRGGVGMGDVKLLGVTGIYLGFLEVLNALLLSMVLASIYGLAIMLVKRQNLQSAIPFAPFIALGAVIVLVSI